MCAAVGFQGEFNSDHAAPHGTGLILGEPAGGNAARIEQLCELLSRAGFEVAPSVRIRYDIWYKLWGNMTMNPVSALTGATMDRALDDGARREAAAVGALIGCNVRESADDRHAVTGKLSAFKTWMLQDVEALRPIELDALQCARLLGRR